MPTFSRKSLGRLGEQLAADHFERLGWQLVERNYQTRLGEIDLIAVDGDTLVFAEVKTCRLGRGQPWDSLHDRKRAQVRKVSGMWFNARAGAIPFWEHDRDALVRLDHLEGAF
jgi:putative endonuclease